MSHALADDRKRDVLALGNARPTMAGNVHGQRYVQSCQTDNFLQRHIDAADGITVVDDIVYIQRGYENFEEKLRSLGAEIEKVSSEKEIQKFRLRVG